MNRRVGRYTKYETAELRRMFDGGYSVYKICRNLNRSQKSIRNNLIRLGKIEGEITSLSKSALTIINEMGYEWGKIAGPQFWMYKGKTLYELNNSKEY